MTNDTRTNAKHLAVFLVVRVAVCIVQAMPSAIAMLVADRIAWLLYRFVPHATGGSRKSHGCVH